VPSLGSPEWSGSEPTLRTGSRGQGRR